MQSEPAATNDPGRVLPHDNTADGDATLPERARGNRPAAAGLAQSLDNHLLQEEIGRGGMGVVYRAWDPVLKRPVALKKIRSGVLADQAEVERFYQEARSAARLQHPNVVPIHGMGLHQGEHCFTMALAPTTLEKQKKRYQADVRAAVTLVEAVARGVQAAHDKGIVHRDLKPANILLDDKGQPLISDFGLAKLCDAGAGESIPGVIKGTPAYMAPEQAAGRTWEVGKSSDVWALGVILYELLTGRLPFEGKNAEDVLPRVLNQEPPRPGAIRPGLAGALEAILRCCLEKQPGRRYPSAKALALDLRCWLGNKPIPRTDSWPRRLRRVLRRRSALIVAILLALVFATVLALLDRRRPGDSGTGLTTGERNQEQTALERLERDLAARRAVELVGESGLPSWHRWRIGTGTLDFPGPGQPLGVGVWGYGFVELVTDPQHDDYEFLAEVRLDSDTVGSVGIACMRVERPVGRGTEHGFLTLTFTPHGPAQALVELNMRSVRPPSIYRKAAGIRKVVSVKRWAWHPLGVKVRRGQLSASWHGQDLGTLGPAQLARCVDDLHKADPAAGLPPVPTPRGGLGLFLFEGAVSVQRIVVKPLD